MKYEDSGLIVERQTRLIGGGIDGLLAESVGSPLCLFQTRKEFSHVPFREVIDVVGFVVDRCVNRV
jgi:hypothetical protein